MNKIVKNFGYRFFRIFSRLLIRFSLLNNQIIVRVDGGICSQMHFYLIGRWFTEKGVKVKYSIDWYKNDGFDLNKVHVRNFDLLTAFPELDFEIASSVECFLYKPFRFTDPNKWKDVTGPSYLCGYYSFPECCAFLTRYFKVDYSTLDQQSQNMRQMIISCENSVAVHVRRGDLAIYLPGYGEPASVEYFKRAVNYLKTHLRKCHFFFFSDEPQYVKDYLIDYLEMYDNYSVVDFNDSAKGYMDLFLVASCNHQITSQGSLGLVGGELNNYPNKIIVCRDDNRSHSFFQDNSNIVYLE